MNAQNFDKKNPLANSVVTNSDLPATSASIGAQYLELSQTPKKVAPQINFQTQNQGEINGIKFGFHGISAQEALRKYNVGFYENNTGEFRFQVGANKGVMTAKSTDEVQVYEKDGKLIIQTSDIGETDSRNSPNVSYIHVAKGGKVVTTETTKKINGVLITYEGILESDVKSDYGVRIFKNNQGQLTYSFKGEKDAPDDGHATKIRLYSSKANVLTLEISNDEASGFKTSFLQFRKLK